MSGGGNGGTSRVLHITQAGQRPRLVGLAPEADPPLSKRDAIFDREVSSAIIVYSFIFMHA